MRRFVDGEAVVLDPEAAEVGRAGDRLWVRTADGVRSALAVSVGDAVLVSYAGRQYRVERKSSRAAGHAAVSNGELLAFMPGSVVDVRCAVGDHVVIGQTLLVLEAMKTHQSIAAPFDGVVERLAVAVGQQVAEGQTLAVVEPA